MRRLPAIPAVLVAIVVVQALEWFGMVMPNWLSMVLDLSFYICAGIFVHSLWEGYGDRDVAPGSGYPAIESVE